MIFFCNWLLESEKCGEAINKTEKEDARFMTKFQQLDKITRILFRKTMFAAVALSIVSWGGTFATSASAQSNQTLPAVGAKVDCDRLPTKEEFIKKDYDKATIKKIQMCLWTKGFFKGRVDGAKGPLTIVALEKYQAAQEASTTDLLVDTLFLSDKIGRPDWVILDTRTPEEYQEGHIQGAVNLGKRADKALRDPTHRSYTMVPACEKVFGAAGISSDKHIILYGKAVDVYYTTVPFWVLEYFGCNGSSLTCTVHYYDGGIERWEADGGKLVQTDTKLPVATFTAHVFVSRLATTDEVLAVVKSKKKAFVIDARTEAEYSGSDIRALRGGHIPGAINIKVQKNYSSDTYRMLPLSELEALYKNIGSSSRVIAHCQTGTRSTYTYLVLRLLGYKNVANYDDSWIVYGSNLAMPVENEQWYDFFEVNRTLKELKEEMK